MTTLKEFYKGEMPCHNCIHKNVCNVKKCFEETKFETSHPFADIQIRCTEYRYYDENKVYREIMKTSCIENESIPMIKPQKKENKE